MSVTLDGGTPQQRAWVQEALAACSYPIDDLGVEVTVNWGPTTGCSLKHSYMCTVEAGDGTFTITIETWADDPNYPDNRGLPNPAQDIKTFYMQSFVHELGHVAQFTLINTDELRTQAAAYFWITDVTGGSGRRYGKLTDFDREATLFQWTHSIKEMIAECFKCAYYSGRLVNSNRTQWHIDEAEWEPMIKMLLPGGDNASWQNEFTLPDLRLPPPGYPPGTYSPGPGTIGYALNPRETRLVLKPLYWHEGSPAGGWGHPQLAVGFDDSDDVHIAAYMVLVVDQNATRLRAYSTSDDEGSYMGWGAGLDGGPDDTHSFSPELAFGVGQYAVLHVHRGWRTYTLSTYETDPDEPGATPTASLDGRVHNPIREIRRNPSILHLAAADSETHVTYRIDYRDIVAPPPPPYPFAPFYGTLDFGPGSVGQLRIGA